MDKIIVRGGNPLFGTVRIAGAKNAALPLMATALLTDDEVALSNVPYLNDIITMSRLLLHHGVTICIDGLTSNFDNGRTIILRGNNINSTTAPYDIVRKMRASVLVLGPLLARFKEAKVSLPGGCAIGPRPLDLHFKAFEKMGADIKLEAGYIYAKCKDGLKGAEILFDKVSVGATENTLMAAVLADGKTILNNAAKEPEVNDLANCLVKMGADIKGIGTSKLEIYGVKELHGASHAIIGDRIEAGTYAIAAAISGGELKLTNIDPELMLSTLEKLDEIGIDIKKDGNVITVSNKKGTIKPIHIETSAYPGLATDMQAQFMALLALADGASVIKENIFENRFMHVPELNRMGAEISMDSNIAQIRGIKEFTGAEVMATDLRASVSLVLAALASREETVLNRVYHLDRGYEGIVEKLKSCGANIRRTG